MSRIGKKPIPLPEGVSVTYSSGLVSIKGPKGKIEKNISHDVLDVVIKDKAITILPKSKDDTARALHGLTRNLVNNMVTGVVNEFQKVLTIVGVGYKAEAKGRELHMALGFSHHVIFKLPTEVTAHTDAAKTYIKLESINKEVLGETAAKIRSFRPPEPYRGKGIRYSTEVIKRKEGKSAGK